MSRYRRRANDTTAVAVAAGIPDGAVQAPLAGGERPGKIRVVVEQPAFELAQCLQLVITEHDGPPVKG
nr:hypothetical protein [Pseudonocardia sp. KRD291]